MRDRMIRLKTDIAEQAPQHGLVAGGVFSVVRVEWGGYVIATDTGDEVQIPESAAEPIDS